jgi:hypothetical protein
MRRIYLVPCLLLSSIFACSSDPSSTGGGGGGGGMTTDAGVGGGGGMTTGVGGGGGMVTDAGVGGGGGMATDGGADAGHDGGGLEVDSAVPPLDGAVADDAGMDASEPLACVVPADCDDDDRCTVDACDSGAGVCDYSPASFDVIGSYIAGFAADSETGSIGCGEDLSQHAEDGSNEFDCICSADSEGRLQASAKLLLLGSDSSPVTGAKVTEACSIASIGNGITEFARCECCFQ